VTDSSRPPRSIRNELRSELAPIQVTLKHIADEQSRQGQRLDKIDGTLHGNGRAGLCERVGVLERAVKSLPPKARDDMPSLLDLEIERTRAETARVTTRWKAAAKIAALLIGSGVIGGGAGCMADHWAGPHRIVVPAPGAAVR